LHGAKERRMGVEARKALHDLSRTAQRICPVNKISPSLSFYLSLPGEVSSNLSMMRFSASDVLKMSEIKVWQ
jgi:hypothetical protein